MDYIFNPIIFRYMMLLNIHGIDPYMLSPKFKDKLWKQAKEEEA